MSSAFGAKLTDGLLPCCRFSFSHCWKSVDPLGRKAISCATNYFMTGLLFKGTVDARYKFEFGPAQFTVPQALTRSTMN